MLNSRSERGQHLLNTVRQMILQYPEIDHRVLMALDEEAPRWEHDLKFRGRVILEAQEFANKAQVTVLLVTREPEEGWKEKDLPILAIVEPRGH